MGGTFVLDGTPVLLWSALYACFLSSLFSFLFFLISSQKYIATPAFQESNTHKFLCIQTSQKSQSHTSQISYISITRILRRVCFSTSTRHATPVAATVGWPVFEWRHSSPCPHVITAPNACRFMLSKLQVVASCGDRISRHKFVAATNALWQSVA
jgi:hypothetical protein